MSSVHETPTLSSRLAGTLAAGAPSSPFPVPRFEVSMLPQAAPVPQAPSRTGVGIEPLASPNADVYLPGPLLERRVRYRFSPEYSAGTSVLCRRIAHADLIQKKFPNSCPVHPAIAISPGRGVTGSRARYAPRPPNPSTTRSRTMSDCGCVGRHLLLWRERALRADPRRRQRGSLHDRRHTQRVHHTAHAMPTTS